MKKYITILILPILFFSCETIVEIEIEPHDPVLAAFGFFQVDESRVTMGVSNSAGFTDTLNDSEIREFAEIELFENGISVGILAPMQNIPGKYELNYSISNVVDTEYEIKISDADFPSISAKQKVLPQPNVISIEDTERTISDDFGENLREYIVTLDDDVSQAEFYSIKVFVVDASSGTNDPVYLSESDITVERGLRKELLASDIIASNNQVELRILAEDVLQWYPPGYILEFWISSISEDRYLYGKSYRNAKEADDNPFAEPVTVHSNIKNGFGIFSIENQVIIQL